MTRIPEAPGVVVWITGLPSSGKSTFAERLWRRLRELGVQVCVLDGDAVRAAWVPTPGYDELARDQFYASLANLAALMARQGNVAIVPATANRAAYRAYARETAPAFLELFVSTPREVCSRRDSKGLYAAAVDEPGLKLPGRGAPYDVPSHPDLIAEGGKDEAALARAAKLVQRRLAELVDPPPEGSAGPGAAREI